ncbi:hypothetical protein HDU77_009020 [Chytriomyces hyalinus]|nr:hypothetical protein HDU77_009020 [Chytriomyces hyalinus]
MAAKGIPMPNSSDKLAHLMQSISLEFDQDSLAPLSDNNSDESRRMSKISSCTSTSSSNGGGGSGGSLTRPLSAMDGLVFPATHDVLSLGFLMASAPAMTGWLHKLKRNESHISPRISLDASSAPPTPSLLHPPRLISTSTTNTVTFTERFFLLTEDATLFLFKSAEALCRPTSQLPLTACGGLYDKQLECWVLQVAGTGYSAEGIPVERHWTLKCEDESTMMQWIDSISIVLECKDIVVASTRGRSTSMSSSYGGSGYVPMIHQQHQQHRTSVSSTTSSVLGSNEMDDYSKSPSLGSSSYLYNASNMAGRPLSVPGPQKRSGGGFGVARPMSELSIQQIEEREARMKAMHEDYVANQMAISEQTRLECQSKREAEANAQRERELLELAERMKRKSDVPKKQKRTPMSLFTNF